MKLIKANIESIENFNRRRNNNWKLLNDFIESGERCMEVVDYTNKNAKSCHGSLCASIKRFKLFSVECISRNDRVFLIKVL